MRAQSQSDKWIVYPGADGPGNGKHIVFVTGDEEYRSEEAMPMMAQILAERYGFKCTVLFAQDPETGEINPENQNNIEGLHQLASADMMVLFVRFRNLPDEQMKHIVDFTNSGKPIIGLRTSTHPFMYKDGTTSAFAKYDWRSKVTGSVDGYGRTVFGETWVNHHGEHGSESQRGLVNGIIRNHPIANGIEDVWGPTDVYGIRSLPPDAQVVLFGQVLSGMKPDSPPNYDKAVMPIAWIRNVETENGKKTRVFFSTIGAAIDLQSEGLRRLLVNAVFWGLEMEDQIPDRANVDYVSPFNPSYFGFGKHKTGTVPADYAIQR